MFIARSQNRELANSSRPARSTVEFVDRRAACGVPSESFVGYCMEAEFMVRFGIFLLVHGHNLLIDYAQVLHA